MTESFDSSSLWSATQVLVSGSMGCLVASLFYMSLTLLKLDSYGVDDSACKTSWETLVYFDSFESHSPNGIY